ncbi:hypothetical protein FRC05_004056 [Tulasnella sp. 425]|nr:hypothetical protein FRC05_004056 [Tulasnella sp. 425]
MSSRDALHAATSQADPRKTLAVHSLSLPSLPRSSNDDHTYAGRNFRDDPAPYASDVFMEDNEAHYDNPGTSARYARLDDVECNSHEAPKKPAMGGHFLGKLYAMLEDKTMTDYIMWRKVEGYDGFFIPDIKSFVRNALPRYFPDQNQWGSFQKQLSNYGFRKKGRDTTQGLYVHWNKKFCRGRRDLLSDVMRRPKAAKTQNSGQEELLTATMPAVPPLSGQSDHVRIGHLENVVSEMAKQLKRMEALVQDLSDRLCAMSIGHGSPNPQVHTGPAGGAVDNHRSIHGADDSNGVDFGFMPPPPIAHDTGASHGLPSHMATEMFFQLDRDFPFQQLPHPPPSTGASFGLLHLFSIMLQCSQPPKYPPNMSTATPPPHRRYKTPLMLLQLNSELASFKGVLANKRNNEGISRGEGPRVEPRQSLKDAAVHRVKLSYTTYQSFNDTLKADRQFLVHPLPLYRPLARSSLALLLKVATMSNPPRASPGAGKNGLK